MNMKRNDILRQRHDIWLEIEHLKKIRALEKDGNKIYQINQKINSLKNKYVFINNLYKANKQ